MTTIIGPSGQYNYCYCSQEQYNYFSQFIAIYCIVNLLLRIPGQKNIMKGRSKEDQKVFHSRKEDPQKIKKQKNTRDKDKISFI